MAPSILSGVSVLVVDDDNDTRETIAEGLRMQGARTAEAGSAQVAMLMAGEFRPDVMLVDLEMPDVDGYTFAKAMRRLTGAIGSIPAIAVTVHNTAEERIKSLSSGFMLHIPKPVDPSELARLIAAFLESRKRPPA